MKYPKPSKVQKARKRVRRVRRARPGLPSTKRLDDLARPLCYARGKCEAAGYVDPRGHETKCTSGLQWAHIVSRARRRNGLRWRMDNCLALCSAHHFRFTNNVEAWREFMEIRWPGRLQALEHEALWGEKPDLREIEAKLLALASEAR